MGFHFGANPSCNGKLSILAQNLVHDKYHFPIGYQHCPFTFICLFLPHSKFQFMEISDETLKRIQILKDKSASTA